MLAGILLKEVNAFVNYKKNSAPQKGKKQLVTWQKATEDRISVLGAQIV